MMKVGVELTKREAEISELIAWGASKKEIADQLCLSERTVENHTRNIYGKLEINKANELSAWWFCTHFHISFNLSPLKRGIGAFVLLAILLPSIFDNSIYQFVRIRTTRTRITNTIRVRSRKKEELSTFEI